MRRPKISLRFLLILVTIVALVFSFWTVRVRQEQKVARIIEDSGGWVAYDFQFDATGVFNPDAKQFVSESMVTVFGRHSFARIQQVSALLGELSDQDLVEMAELTGLKAISNNHVKSGGSVSSLMFSKLGPPGASETRALASGHLVTDTGLQSLARCKTLRSIALMSEGITDAGIEYLSSLGELRYLAIGSSGVTDASIDSLSRMTSLQQLVVTQTNLSNAGIERLRNLMPWCQICTTRTL